MGRLLPDRQRMVIVLTELSEAQVTGVYGKSGDWMPPRARYLELEAARSYVHELESVRVSDMFRGPDAQLRALKTRKGSQWPGKSGHGFGFSIDLDVSSILREHGWNKPKLDGWMNARGWFCHRRDSRRGIEDWHYNHFGEDFSRYVEAGDRRTSAGLERMIVDVYGDQFVLDRCEVQIALAELSLYSGEIDADHGPLTRQAVRAFQRAWKLRPDGIAGPQTQRLLSYVTAEHQYVEL